MNNTFYFHIVFAVLSQSLDGANRHFNLTAGDVYSSPAAEGVPHIRELLMSARLKQKQIKYALNASYYEHGSY